MGSALLHSTQAVHSSSGKERRNLGWVGIVGIYQHEEFIMCSLLSHTPPAPSTRQPHTFLQAYDGRAGAMSP